MKATFFALALALIAVVVGVKAVRDRNAGLADLQAARDAARAAAARADTLDVENASLRKQLATVRSQGVSDIELARLRADATELRRMKPATPAPKASASPVGASQTPALAKPANPEVVAYSLEGTVRVAFGGMVVGGGWRLQEGKRAFLFASPTLDDAGSVMLDARLVEMPDAVVERFGLQDVVAGGRASDKFFTRDAAARAELIRNLEQTEGVDVLSGPRVLTRSGHDATIQVQGNPESGEPGIRIGFTPTVQAGGANLDLGIKLKFLPEEVSPTR